MVAGIAGLLVEDEEIMNGFEQSIRTLAEYQHPYGMIPSNVLPDESAPETSYGGLAGRVDATTWFVAGSCIYLSHSRNQKLKRSLQPHLLQALEILGRWEFNGKGLLYTPLSGNWADEYPVEGHTLYDNCLRLWGLEQYAKLYEDDGRAKQAQIIRERIAINFWPRPETGRHPAVYHRRSFKEAAQKNRSHFACAIDPKGYNDHFDAAGHGLAMLLGIADEDQLKKIKNYANNVFDDIGADLLPAFWPVIKESDPEWHAIRQNYSFDFKNKPHHFHNGGIWPVWMGLFGLGMSCEQESNVAGRILQAWMNVENTEAISFAEYIASDSLQPGGKQRLSYSASGLIFLLSAIEPNKAPRYLVH